MQFDPRDIRASMDVYTADHIYLGSVLYPPDSRPRTHDNVESVIGVEGQPSEVSGELLGPKSTSGLGNTGPVVQSSQRLYATGPDDHRVLVEGTFTVGKWWGLVGRRRIHLNQVQSVSMDNVILQATSDELA